VFQATSMVPEDALAICIDMALTYHRNKQRSKKSPGNPGLSKKQ